MKSLGEKFQVFWIIFSVICMEIGLFKFFTCFKWGFIIYTLLENTLLIKIKIWLHYVYFNCSYFPSFLWNWHSSYFQPCICVFYLNNIYLIKIISIEVNDNLFKILFLKWWDFRYINLFIDSIVFTSDNLNLALIFDLSILLGILGLGTIFLISYNK